MRSLILLTSAFLISGIQSAQAQCNVSATPVNITIDCGDTLTLSASGIGGTAALSNDFNLGTVGPGWNVSPAGQFNNPCGPGLNGSHMWMGSTTAAPREMQTAPLDVSCGGTICFDFRMAIQGAASPCEGPDLVGEGVNLDYYDTGTASWTTIFYFQPNTAGSFNSESPGSGDYTAWATYCFAIPPAAATPNTQFRWWQSGSSGSGFDHWGIDEVQIYSTCDPYYYIWENVSYTQDTVVMPDQDTTYNVMFTNLIDDTCYASVTIDIIEPDFNIWPEDTILCQGDAAQFTMTSTGIPAIVGQGDFQWSPPTGLSDPNIATPIAGPTTTTTYVITYQNQLAPQCTADDTITVNIAPGFNYTLDVDNPDPCLGEPIQFLLDITTPGAFTYEWTPTAFLDDPNAEDPLISTFIPNGPYTYYVYITSPNGCVRLDSVTFTVANAFPPNIEASATDSAICLGDTTYLNVVETNFNPNMVYSWTPPSEVSDPNISNPYSATFGNTMYVVYGVDTTNGCDAWDTVWVTNYPDPSFTITASPDNGFAPLNVVFNANSNDSLINHVWVIGDTSNTSNDTMPTNTFNNPGTYPITLYATNEWGCAGVAYTTVVVTEDLESFVSIPNVFSPNGDGWNDEFFITSYNLVEFHCDIMNRWGKKVYEWDDETKGWDGKIGGADASEGTYYYLLRAVGVDDEVYEQQGSFTLVKGK